MVVFSCRTQKKEQISLNTWSSAQWTDALKLTNTADYQIMSGRLLSRRIESERSKTHPRRINQGDPGAQSRGRRFHGRNWVSRKVTSPSLNFRWFRFRPWNLCLVSTLCPWSPRMAQTITVAKLFATPIRETDVRKIMSSTPFSRHQACSIRTTTKKREHLRWRTNPTFWYQVLLSPALIEINYEIKQFSWYFRELCWLLSNSVLRSLGL